MSIFRLGSAGAWMSMSDRLAALVRTLQIICAALVAGVLGLAAVSLVIVDQASVSASATPLGVLGVVAPVAATLASYFLPGVIFRQSAASYAVKNPKPGLASMLQASGAAVTVETIVAMALREGGAMLGLVVWLVEGNLLGLFGSLIGLIPMILGFPTKAGVEQRLADFRAQVKS
jgi:hypothetical protein